MAVESVLADGDAPYNPLLFVGPSGTGKSHLASGLLGAWKSRFRRRPAVRVTATDFARQLAEAIQTKTTEDFARRYRRLSLLVFEDLQHLAEKGAAQRELRFTLDALAGAGARLVFTCAALPSELPGIDAGLKSRLEEGLTVPLAPPGRETRAVIVRRLAESLGLQVPDEAAQVLTHGLRVTVPELSGALKQLSGADRTGLNAEAARRFVARQNGTNEPTLHRIASTTARYFSLPLANLKSASRRRQVAIARAVAMYLARDMTSQSLQEIGRYFGSRDHTTVSYGCHVTEGRLKTDPQVRHAVVALQDRLKEP